MKPKEKIIVGTYTGHDTNGMMEWEAPDGFVMTAYGQFELEYLSNGQSFYSHKVYDEDDCFLYEVIATA